MGWGKAIATGLAGALAIEEDAVGNKVLVLRVVPTKFCKVRLGVSIVHQFLPLQLRLILPMGLEAEHRVSIA